MTGRRRARRAPDPDAATWTPADRAAIQQSRINAQSSRYQREAAVDRAFSRAAPAKEPKP